MTKRQGFCRAERCQTDHPHLPGADCSRGQRGPDKRPRPPRKAPETVQISSRATLVALVEGVATLLRLEAQSAALMARLAEYRREHPERFGHLAAFTEGIDKPTPEQATEHLARAVAASVAATGAIP